MSKKRPTYETLEPFQRLRCLLDDYHECLNRLAEAQEDARSIWAEILEVQSVLGLTGPTPAAADRPAPPKPKPPKPRPDPKPKPQPIGDEMWDAAELPPSGTAAEPSPAKPARNGRRIAAGCTCDPPRRTDQPRGNPECAARHSGVTVVPTEAKNGADAQRLGGVPATAAWEKVKARLEGIDAEANGPDPPFVREPVITQTAEDVLGLIERACRCGIAPRPDLNQQIIWASMQHSGATNQEIVEQLKAIWPHSPSCSPEGPLLYTIRGGPDPGFWPGAGDGAWIKDPHDHTPTYRGQALIDRVRQAMSIPTPAAARKRKEAVKA